MSANNKQARLWVIVIMAALLLAFGSAASRVFAASTASTTGASKQVSQSSYIPDARSNTGNAPNVNDSFMVFQSGANGYCPAPNNGGMTFAGCRFVLDL